MAGMRIASTDGAGWTVETVELILTRRTPRRPGPSPVPLGDGAQLRVTRNGNLIGYVLSPGDLPALGVDLSRMAVVARWFNSAIRILPGAAMTTPPDVPSIVR